MKDLSKIDELFHYFNVRSEVDSVYGHWAVSKNGDVVNYVYPYIIMSIHLDEENWLDVLRSKIWFREECTQDIKMAIERAKEIKIA